MKWFRKTHLIFVQYGTIQSLIEAVCEIIVFDYFGQLQEVEEAPFGDAFGKVGFPSTRSSWKLKRFKEIHFRKIDSKNNTQKTSLTNAAETC